MICEVFPQEMTNGVRARLAADALQAQEPFQDRPSAGGQSTPRGSTPPAENSLIQAAAAGDLSAFNQLVILYQDSLYGWVCSLVNDEAAAEDITQQAFITAYEKLRDFRGGSFRAWLFTIARNRSFDALRRQKRFPSFSLDAAPDEDFDQLEILPDSALLPEDALLEAEQAAGLERLLRQLPGAHQQVVRLVDMEGLDYHEAAQVLGVPLGTVKSRLTRARLKMRDLFRAANWL